MREQVQQVQEGQVQKEPRALEWKEPELWAIVLAAGEGKRLSQVTKSLYGWDIPKQFAALDGERTLLQQTMNRLATLVPPARTVVVVAEDRRELAELQLRQYDGVQIVSQPANAGTGPGVLLPLSVIKAQAPDATVIVTPSDHHVAGINGFVAALRRAQEVARHGAPRASEPARGGRGRERTAAFRGLDDDRHRGERGDQAVAADERAGTERRTGLDLAQQRAALRDLAGERLVMRGRDRVQPRGDHRDRGAAGGERPAVRRGVDAAGQPADDGAAEHREIPGEPFGHREPVRARGARAHERHAAPGVRHRGAAQEDAWRNVGQVGQGHRVPGPARERAPHALVARAARRLGDGRRAVQRSVGDPGPRVGAPGRACGGPVRTSHSTPSSLARTS